jgi:hypothetical protein
VDIVIALIAFFALVATWFALPASPRTAVADAQTTATTETLARAA